MNRGENHPEQPHRRFFSAALKPLIERSLPVCESSKALWRKRSNLLTVDESIVSALAPPHAQ